MTTQEFVAALDARFADYAFSSNQGKKYTKVMTSFRGQTSFSVFCFIDQAGNIYKPDGWRKPAKGVRSTLATVDITKVDPFGSWLYRAR